jgi:hypothetical protein
MSYRDEGRMMRERLRELDGALRANRAASETLHDEEERLRAERRTLDDELRRRRVLPLLDGVRVASPCTESWSEMSGDDRKRFCGKCEKNVYDLSAMTRDEAEAFLATHEGACIRFYRRFDGTVLTSDCPVGVKHRRRRRVALVAGAAAGAGMLACLWAMQRPVLVTGSAETMGQVQTSAPKEAQPAQSVPLPILPTAAPPNPTMTAPKVKNWK